MSSLRPGSPFLHVSRALLTRPCDSGAISSSWTRKRSRVSTTTPAHSTMVRATAWNLATALTHYAHRRPPVRPESLARAQAVVHRSTVRVDASQCCRPALLARLAAAVQPRCACSCPFSENIVVRTLTPSTTRSSSMLRTDHAFTANTADLSLPRTVVGTTRFSTITGT